MDVPEGIIIKLNIGCGGRWKKMGWYGLDWRMTYQESCSGNFECDIDHNLREGIPLKDNCVSHLFACHIFEHFSYHEATRLAKEMYRVLIPGGIVRVIVPDIDVYLEKYLKKDVAFLKDMKFTAFTHMPTLIDYFLSILYGDPKFNSQCHKYGYNSESLKFKLAEGGFKLHNINKCSPEESKYGEWLDRSFFSSSHQDLIKYASLHMEAEK